MQTTIDGRVASVDFGTKRVGLALADPMRMFAQPFGTFSQSEAANRLGRLHAEEGIAVVIVGWPLMEDGSEGIATERVQQYINRLRRQLPGVQFIRWDERYTSEEAKEVLRGTGRPVSRERVDAAAAGIILQEYLDAQARNRNAGAS